jgi:hypothetical protein
LFTLRNPHNLRARRFELKGSAKNDAIYCDSSCGPHFWDILVSDGCDANTQSGTDFFGSYYVNDTGLDGPTFLAGSRRFTVKEIEVFEISTPCPPGWDSVIVSKFPDIFAEFSKRQFTVL